MPIAGLRGWRHLGRRFAAALLPRLILEPEVYPQGQPAAGSARCQKAGRRKAPSPSLRHTPIQSLSAHRRDFGERERESRPSGALARGCRALAMQGPGLRPNRPAGTSTLDRENWEVASRRCTEGSDYPGRLVGRSAGPGRDFRAF